MRPLDQLYQPHTVFHSLARLLEELLVGHRRSVTLGILGDVILLEAAIRLAYLRAAVSERKTCEIGRLMRELVEPNCMRNGALEAYVRPIPTSPETVETLAVLTVQAYR